MYTEHWVMFAKSLPCSRWDLIIGAADHEPFLRIKIQIMNR
jgi:hypothetical protein